MSTDANGSRTTKRYQEAYSALNDAQKKAVDQTEDPLMVIAGPGTGKTQILALRIGNILLKTDAQPQNILCLTYTEAGSIAMRKRLLEFIGTEAYKVNVHTYHSFCNQVIQDNQEFFSDYAELVHISELEKTQMLHDHIDALPAENPLRRMRGQYFEASRMASLFSLMKREFWSPEFLLEKIEEEREKIKDKSNSTYFYTRGRGPKKIGDPKATYFKAKHQLEYLEEAVKQFDPIQNTMREMGRYDYDDMIHWVVKAFSAENPLLASYQERFLYFLVDEFQDTNGSQFEIVLLLVNFWDRPNLFVVGDEDQAIFRFQGASIDNLKKLHAKYNPEVIVLSENYRSTQPILDASTFLISQNPNRLGDQLEGVTNNLRAQSKIGTIPTIHEYLNVAQEEAAIFDEIKRLHTEGEKLDEIAIIYRKHFQSSNLIKAFSLEGIPYNVKSRTDILLIPLVRNLIKILTFLSAELQKPGSQDGDLFEIMHYRFFDIPPTDLARISQYCWKRRWDPISLRHTIKDIELLQTLNLNSVPALVEFSEKLDRWLQLSMHVTVQVLFERILKEGNILGDIIKGRQSTYHIQVLGTFFNYIKKECLRHPDLTLFQLVKTLEQMKNMGLKLELQNLIRNKNGVNFLTAHGAKGLEFKRVYIIGCNHYHWKGKKNNNSQYTLPGSLNNVQTSTDADERRLFYVAMTRAKERLTISYALERLTGMKDEASKFVGELIAGNKAKSIEKHVTPEKTRALYLNILSDRSPSIPLLDHELIDKKLERMQISSTGLNLFLKCQRSFYFEKILGIPWANNQFLGYGNAVHATLHIVLDKIRKKIPSTEENWKIIFHAEMERRKSFFTEKQFESYLHHGKIILPQYISKNMPLWKSAKDLYLEKPLNNIVHKGVPITGRIDLMLKGNDNLLKVIDFKTGKHDKNKIKRPKKLDELGGNYWRQVIFYKILLQENKDPNLQMAEGIMSFIDQDETGNFFEELFLPSLDETEKVSGQITESFQKMKNHEFDVNCKDQNCTWCNFVKNDFVLPPTFPDEDPEFEREPRFDGDSFQLSIDF